ncbi:MAG: THUMP domain-containing protein [Candidatus Hadarchaeales archaeon]
MKVVVVRYGEIALKSGPVRSKFEKILLSNIRRMIRSFGHAYKKSTRIIVESEFPWKVCKVISKIPGVVSCSPAVRVRSVLPEIVQNATKIAKRTVKKGETFAVRTSREGKHEFTSMDVNRIVGESILRSLPGSKVDLSNPDREIFIDIREDETYIFTEKISGVGGLPVGSEGKAICIFDGSGRDVKAAFLMMKRGCVIQILSEASNVHRAKSLLVHHPHLTVFILPESFTKSIKQTPPRLRTIVKKRALVKIADLLSVRTGSVCLVLPDGLEFVRKFGLEGIRFVDEASSNSLILRPLLGGDLLKAEPKPSSKIFQIQKKRVLELEREILKDLDGIVNSLVRRKL